ERRIGASRHLGFHRESNRPGRISEPETPRPHRPTCPMIMTPQPREKHRPCQFLSAARRCPATLTERGHRLKEPPIRKSFHRLSLQRDRRDGTGLATSTRTNPKEIPCKRRDRRRIEANTRLSRPASSRAIVNERRFVDGSQATVLQRRRPPKAARGR